MPMTMVSPQIPSAYLGNLGHQPGPVPPGTVSWESGSDHRRSMSSPRSAHLARTSGSGRCRSPTRFC